MNIFILGCGRSGTSLVTGLFRNTGMNLGEDSYKPRQSNPLGFFEDRKINNINEEILSRYLPDRLFHNGFAYGSDIPLNGQRWLSRIHDSINIEATSDILQRIENKVHNEPFCFKDPRFCYTLDIWRQKSPNSKYIMIFRNPSDVVTSILNEIKTMPYLYNFSLSVNTAFETWRAINQYPLINFTKTGDWLFVQYEDLFLSETLDRIEKFTKTRIDRNFPDKNLNRSKSELKIDNLTQKLYDELKERTL